MKFNDLNITKNKPKTRVGRGISAGKGKTAGRGTKGQNARTGKKLRPGFEGGQTSLMQRIPKLKGFKSKKAKAQIVYTSNLELIKEKTIDNFTMTEYGLIASPYHMVKIITKGPVNKSMTIKTQSASKSAVDLITKAGGSFESVEVSKRKAESKNTD